MTSFLETGPIHIIWTKNSPKGTAIKHFNSVPHALKQLKKGGMLTINRWPENTPIDPNLLKALTQSTTSRQPPSIPAPRYIIPSNLASPPRVNREQ
jgi:hypothetical protein